LSGRDLMISESAFGFEAPEDSPGLLLWQTTVTWQRLIKKVLEPHDISHGQFVIMAVLLWFEEHHQESTQVAIARLSKLDKMTVSKSLKKLVAQGLVTRVEHATDTRAKSVFLTIKGKAMVSKLVPLVEQVDAEFFGQVREGDQQSLIRILRTLTSGQNDG
jgi:DNA-binding MarR family transcriptional regulator